MAYSSTDKDGSTEEKIDVPFGSIFTLGLFSLAVYVFGSFAINGYLKYPESVPADMRLFLFTVRFALAVWFPVYATWKYRGVFGKGWRRFKKWVGGRKDWMIGRGWWPMKSRYRDLYRQHFAHARELHRQYTEISLLDLQLRDQITDLKVIKLNLLLEQSSFEVESDRLGYGEAIATIERTLIPIKEMHSQVQETYAELELAVAQIAKDRKRLDRRVAREKKLGEVVELEARTESLAEKRAPRVVAEAMAVLETSRSLEVELDALDEVEIMFTSASEEARLAEFDEQLAQKSE